MPKLVMKIVMSRPEKQSLENSLILFCIVVGRMNDVLEPYGCCL